MHAECTGGHEDLLTVGNDCSSTDRIKSNNTLEGESFSTKDVRSWMTLLFNQNMSIVVQLKCFAFGFFREYR